MIRTTCPYCGVGCGLIVGPDGSLTGDPEHPANYGRLCSKGAALDETLSADGRLLRPTINGRAATWDEALDLVAAQFSYTIREHGSGAVALYVSGQFLTEDYYVANKLMKGFVGTANIDTNSRLCMASSVAGHTRAFGADIVPGCYEDIEGADLVVLVGSNAAWCHPVLYQRLVAAREVRGTRVVVIDPRRTATCDIADLHLALRPGSDVAVFAGLLVHLAESGLCDPAWTHSRATGFDEALAAARETAPSLEAVAKIADVAPRDLAQFYDLFRATERVVTLYSQGVNQSSAGTDKVNAIINCHLATGRIGRPGMGPFSLTGQPNAMGGREVGGLATQLAAHMSFASAADRDRVRRFWKAPNMASQPGLKAVDMFDAVLDGKVKALWVLGTNPADSMPRADRVRAALAACPFVVVSDCWASDTADFADVLLPAAGWGEKDGTVTNSERRISRQRGFRLPPGEARPDWWTLSEVARRLSWGAAFSYRKPADIFREHAALSAFENDGRRVFDIGAFAEISDAEYDALVPQQWPLPKGGEGATRLFGDGTGFPTADGRARFIAVGYRPPAEVLEPGMVVLNTGRVRDQWHTMTRTGRVPRLMAHRTEPLLDIHADDASQLGLADGDLARVESRHGAAVMPIRISAEPRPGEVFAPMHWSDKFSSSGPIDRLVGGATDPVSGQPELKATPVTVGRLTTRWRGFLLRRSAIMPRTEGDDAFYWARIPIAAGHAYELAGWQELPQEADAEAWVMSLLGAPGDAELIVYVDQGRGALRYASIVDGCFDACLFLARDGGFLPGRAELEELLGGPVERPARLSLVAGLPASALGADSGPIICACFAVGLKTLRRAIVERELDSVAAIGEALRAGTNCGSCRPELRAILDAALADA